MAGFARDITTPIDIPTVQAPNFNDNVSTTQDVIDIASFGLQFQQRKNAQAAETRRQQRIQAVGSAAFDTFNKISDIKSQRDVTSIDILKLTRLGEGKFSSPSEKALFNEQLSGLLDSGVFKASIGDDLTQAETTKQSLRSLDSIAVSSALSQSGFTDINEIPDNLLGEVEALALSIQSKQDSIKQAASDVVKAPSSRGFGKFSTTLMDNGIDLMASNLALTLTQIRELGTGTPEAKGKVQEIRTNLTNALGQMKSQMNQVANQVLDGASKDEATRIKDLLNLSNKQLDDQALRLSELTDQEFQDTAAIASELTNQREIEVSKSFPFLLQMKKILGEGPMQLMLQKVLSSTKKGSVIVDSVEERLSRGILNIAGQDINVGEAALNSGDMSLKEFNHLFNGDPIGDKAIEDRNAAIADRWNWMSSFIKDPKLIEGISKDENTMDKLGIGMIEVLKTAEEDGTKEDKANASELLASPLFLNYMSKIKPEQAEAISRYVASNVAITMGHTLEDKSFLSAKYDASSGKFVTPETAKEPQVLNQGALGVTKQKQTRAEKLAKKLNAQLDTASKILEQYSPFLKGNNSDARDYLVSFVPKNSIIGTPKDFTPEEQDAVATGVSQEDFLKRIEANNRLEKIRKSSAKVLENVISGQDKLNSQDTSAKDSEEIQLIKALREAPDRETQIAILDELNKLNAKP